jgi:putative nucleotidyltransferase with HDIG domain
MNTEWTFEFCPQNGDAINFVGMVNSPFLGPIIKSMIFCQQDVKYHAEGDVWTHTQMSLKHLVTLRDYQDLPRDEKQIVFLATLLHDVGKPVTTKEDEEAITSKGHSVKGARLARELIINWNSSGLTNIPFKAREQICNLVLLHMLPVYLLEKTDPLYSAASSSMVVNNKHLATLAISDIEGRICAEESKVRAKERVELFTLFCEENKCYTSPYPFISDRSKFRYFFEHKGHPNYDYFEPVHGKVIVMCGLQASGKDYVIQHKYPEWKVVSLDQTRIDMDLDFGDNEPEVIQKAKDQCKTFMREKTNFIFNATNVVKDIRTRWINLFRQYRYHISVYYKERPLGVILKANKNREHVVPEEVILEKVKKIDIPTPMECHELILDVD